jgi:hypothetical protein
MIYVTINHQISPQIWAVNDIHWTKNQGANENNIEITTSLTFTCFDSLLRIRTSAKIHHNKPKIAPLAQAPREYTQVKLSQK